MAEHIRIVYDNVRKFLTDVKSPNGNFRIVISESGSNEISSTTNIMINSKTGGKTVYDAFGINLGIKAYWKNNETAIVETKKGLTVLTKSPQVQFSNSIIEIEFIEE